MKAPVRADLALDDQAVLHLVADAVERWAGFRPLTCRAQLRKQTERRLLLFYELADGSRSATVVGKWYSTERGALVAATLTHLRQCGFDGRTFGVPAVLLYAPAVRALFMEFMPGPRLLDRVPHDPLSTRPAGAWLAAFHHSGLTLPRDCGPAKQIDSLRRWGHAAPRLRELGQRLTPAIGALPNGLLPVHYDYYYSHVILQPHGPTVVVDFDEAGRGDAAIDVAHFLAHLQLLGLQQEGSANAYSRAGDAFREGYQEVVALPEPRPALEAFAWFKLAYQLVRREAPAQQQAHAVAEVERSLSNA